MRIVFDASSTQSARRLDANGYLHVTGCPITSFGVFDYARSEAELPGEPNEIVKVLRRKETITAESFIASCQNLPIIDNHTYMEGMVLDAENGEEDGIDPDKKGVNGAMVNARFDELTGWVVADLVFYSRAMIRLILSNTKVELSLGYTSKFVQLVDQAEAAEQIEMFGNHLALVGRARVPGARVLDSAFSEPTPEGVTMSTKKKTFDADALSALREALLPALTGFLESQGAAPAEAAAPAAAGEVAAPAVAEAAAPAAAAEATAAETGAEVAEVPAKVPAEDEAGAGAGEEVCALIKQLIATLGAPAAAPAAAAVGDEDLEAGAVIPNGDEESEEQVAAKPTMDAMFAAVAQRDQLYQRVSRVVGTFDHAAMTHEKVAKYGVAKLGIKCADGHEVTALDAYLLATDTAAAKAVATTKKVGDSAVSSLELDAYLAGKK